MNKKYVWILPFLALFICAGDNPTQNYIGKTPQQLSGFTIGDNNIGSTSWWYNYTFKQLSALFYAHNLTRHSGDYSNIQAAVDSGYTLTIDPNDTVVVTSAINLTGVMSIYGVGSASRIEASGCNLAELDSTEDTGIIDGVYFYGDGNFRGLELDDADNWTIINCTFNNFTTAIKMIGTATNVNVVNCNFIACDTAVAGVNEYNVINCNNAVNFQYNKREISLIDFGADATTDSVDNQTAFDDAIEWATQNDVSVINIPKGTYWTRVVTLTSIDSLTFKGQPGTIIKTLQAFPSDYATTTYTFGVFEIFGCDYLTFDGLYFDLGASNWSPTSNMCPLYFKCTSGVGTQSNNITIKNCVFNDCASIRFYATASDTAINGVTITNNTFQMADTLAAIQFYTGTQCFNAIITNNHFYGNDTGAQFVLGPGQKIVVANNTVHRASDSGIYLSSPDCIISNNYVEGCGKDGIKVIHSSGRNVVVTNNIVKGVGRCNRASNVGYNFEASRVILNGNIFISDTTGGNFYWSVQHAVKFGANADSSIISNNQFYGMGILGGQSDGSGIRLSAGVTDLQIHGNTFHGFEYGIVGLGNNTARIYIQDNYFYDNRSNDIRFADSYTGKSCIVAQNNIFRDSNYPFIVKTIDTLIISNNTFLGSLDHNIVTNQGSVTSYYNHNNLRPGTVPSFLSFQIPAGDSFRVGAGTYIWEMEKVSAVDSFDIITSADTLRIGVKRYPK